MIKELKIQIFSSNIGGVD